MKPTAPLLLVRHADAGDRSAWKTDQDLRPLTDRGQRQAEGIAARLQAFAPARILSSPAVRCVQTVEPLARALGVAVEIADELHEGLTTEALRLIDGTPMALSSHGDVLPELLAALTRDVDGVSRDPSFEKGAAWVLDVEPEGRAVTAHYFPPTA